MQFFHQPSTMLMSHFNASQDPTLYVQQNMIKVNHVLNFVMKGHINTAFVVIRR